MNSNAVVELLERNKQYASNHTPIPTITELRERKVRTPHSIIVSCADGRVMPEKFFQLTPQDAVVVRNVAGHPQASLSDILALDAFLHPSKIIVVHHTDCGATYFTNESIRSEIKNQLPEHEGLDTMEFGAITDLEQSVKDDLDFLRTSPLIRSGLREHSYGFLYDIKSGELREVHS